MPKVWNTKKSSENFELKRKSLEIDKTRIRLKINGNHKFSINLRCLAVKLSEW